MEKFDIGYWIGDDCFCFNGLFFQLTPAFVYIDLIIVETRPTASSPPRGISNCSIINFNGFSRSVQRWMGWKLHSSSLFVPTREQLLWIFISKDSCIYLIVLIWCFRKGVIASSESRQLSLIVSSLGLRGVIFALLAKRATRKLNIISINVTVL